MRHAITAPLPTDGPDTERGEETSGQIGERVCIPCLGSHQFTTDQFPEDLEGHWAIRELAARHTIGGRG